MPAFLAFNYSFFSPSRQKKFRAAKISGFERKIKRTFPEKYNALFQAFFFETWIFTRFVNSGSIVTVKAILLSAHIICTGFSFLEKKEISTLAIAVQTDFLTPYMNTH